MRIQVRAVCFRTETNYTVQVNLPGGWTLEKVYLYRLPAFFSWLCDLEAANFKVIPFVGDREPSWPDQMSLACGGTEEDRDA